MTNASPGLFQREETVLLRATSLLNEMSTPFPKWKDYEELKQNYEKLCRESQRLLRFSDRNERRLKELTIELRQALEEVERLRQLALDANPLTQLPGNNTIRREIQRALDESADVAVIYADLDHFKPFNDYYGFHRGDMVIQFTAMVFREALAPLGEKAFLGHIGGDDFVMILPSEEADRIAESILRRFDREVRDLYDPADRDRGSIVCKDREGNLRQFSFLALSMAGIRLPHSRCRCVLEVANLCNEVKKDAKAIAGSVLVWDRRGIGASPLTETTSFAALRVGHEIWRMIEEDRIVMHFQPILSLGRGEISIVEALARGVMGEELIPPTRLFSEAARNKMTATLDRHCHRKALEAFRMIRAAYPDLFLALNCDSASMVEEEETVQALVATIEALKLDPTRIIIELLESQVADHLKMKSLSDRIHAEGFLLAIDDVGAGYSSLSRIALIKPDLLKVDRSLTTDLADDYHKQAILTKLVEMAHRIGALVVVEGVERLEDIAAARDLGIDLFQGFFFSPPLEPARLAFPYEAMKAVRKQAKQAAENRRMAILTYQRMLDKILARMQGLSQKDFFVTLRRILGENDLLLSLCVLGEEGEILAEAVRKETRKFRLDAISPPPHPRPVLDIEAICAAIRSGEAEYISDPLVTLSGSRCRILARRFIGADGSRHILACEVALCSYAS